MPSFLRCELWSDVECNSGVRLGVFERNVLGACSAQWTLDGQDLLTVAITRDAPYRNAITRGQVIRVCTTDASDFDEWRIANIEDTSDGYFTALQCDAIALDLSRALVMATDGVGAATAEYTASDIDLDGILDAPVRDALDDAALTWLVKGTVEPTDTFDIDSEWVSARQLVLDAITRAGGELRVRRNGTADYRIDILDAIGSDAPVVTARTARNLLSTKRRLLGTEGGTRIAPRGRDDATHRGIGYAYWAVTAVDTGTDEITIRDPRGAGFPRPLEFAGMADGWYVSRLVPTFASHAVLDSQPAGTGESVITVADASTFSIGDLVEFRLGALITDRRVWALTSPAAVALYGGIHDRVLDRPQLSGSVNYAENPFVRDYTGEIRIDNPSGAGGITTTGGSPVVAIVGGSGAATGIQVGDRMHRTSDDALVGTVLTIDSTFQVSLAANAAVVGTNFDFYVYKDAPVGAVAAAINQRYTLTSQVDSNAPGVTSKAWRIVRPNGVDGMQLRITPFPLLRTSTALPLTIWCWVEVVAMNATLDLDFKLLRADTLAQLGDTVTLTSSEVGQIVRVQFVGVDLSAATAGVVIEMTQAANQSEYILGPWGVQPSAWAIVDVETPRACDLWHEGTLWLQSAVLPEGYDLDIVDLEQIEGGRFPFDALTLGGSIRIDDRDLGVVTTQRLVALTRDYLTPGEVSLTLGRRQRGLAEYLAQQNTASVSDIANRIARGLITQADVTRAAPTAIAEYDPNTSSTLLLADDPDSVEQTGRFIRLGFRAA